MITGGAGGLGQLFAKEIAKQVEQATVILVGRSPSGHVLKNMEIPSNIRVVYERADVTDGHALKTLLREIKQKYGVPKGIIHSAGVVQDSLIRHKTKAELEAVMAAKVDGLIHLDQATQDVPLDFFSSAFHQDQRCGEVLDRPTMQLLMLLWTTLCTGVIV